MPRNLIHDPISVEEAYRLLVATMIEQAIEQYRAYERKGWIAGGVVLLPRYPNLARARKNKMSKKVLGVVVTRVQAEELMEFLSPGGGMDQWIATAWLAVDPDTIRRKLGIPNAVSRPRSGAAKLGRNRKA